MTVQILVHLGHSSMNLINIKRPKGPFLLFMDILKDLIKRGKNTILDAYSYVANKRTGLNERAG